MMTDRILWLIAFVTLRTVLGLFAGPAWGSLMADLVPAYMRGRYFAFRGRISVLTMLVFGLIAGGDLNFNYATYMIISLCNALAQFAFQAFWGRRADRAGNLMLLKVASSLVPFVPLIWMLNTNPFYLMGTEVFSGLARSGFNLAASNFIYDASEPENRTKQLAILNAFNMLGGALGAVVGGYITPHVPSFLGYNLRSLMLISGLTRGLVVLIFVRSIVEVRQVPKISLKQFILGN